MNNDLLVYKRNIYSQNGEDGIIQYLFSLFEGGGLL